MGVRTVIAQLDLVVGDVRGNTDRIIDVATRARDELDAELVVFPELSICGYPPEDLLLHAGLRRSVNDAVEEIRTSLADVAVLIGYPEYAGDEVYNSASVIKDGDVLCHYRKRCLELGG